MIISQEVMAPKRNMIYNIPVRINPVNDAPELKPGADSETLWITDDSKWDPKKFFILQFVEIGISMSNSENLLWKSMIDCKIFIL